MLRGDPNGEFNCLTGLAVRISCFWPVVSKFWMTAVNEQNTTIPVIAVCTVSSTNEVVVKLDASRADASEEARTLAAATEL